MKNLRPAINILTDHETPLFPQHFYPGQGWEVVENGPADRIWDMLIVFEGTKQAASYQVRRGGLIFIAGEPPQIGNHSRTFLGQFDAVYCARAPRNAAAMVSHEQHFNNWHFGYNRTEGNFRYGHVRIRDWPRPAKSRVLSTITSNLNYLPMHIRRRALVDRLNRDFPGQIDVLGRPHRFIEYKEDAILPYRFHLCVENCSVPGLWTEKIADALLSFSVPLYAGCPDIETYFPKAVISIDLDDYQQTKNTISDILAEPEAIYEQRLSALIEARRRLIEEYDISSLIAHELQRSTSEAPVVPIRLVPETAFPLFKARDLTARAKRKVIALFWRSTVGFDG